MAGDITPPGGAIRFIQTTRGLLSYSPLAPLLAERALRVEADIASGRSDYFAALRAGGSNDWRLLMKIEEQCFERLDEAGL